MTREELQQKLQELTLRKKEAFRRYEARLLAIEETQQAALREQLYAMRPTTRLRPSQLSEAMRAQKYYMVHKYSYFADPDHPYWLCYDSQTRRSVKAEANAKARGFEIVEGEDDI